MTKLTILWVAILSLLATTALLLFHGAAFQTCYSEHITLFTFQISRLSLFQNCILATGTLCFLLLFLGPILLTLLIYALYVIIFNQPMTAVKYVLWGFWIIFLYFAAFDLNLAIPI